MRFRVVFMGSPEFSVPTLRALNAQFEVIGIITQPDRPSGRGRKLTPNPVKKEADTSGIPCIQPESLSDISVRNQLSVWLPNVIVVVAYGKMLPQWILEFPEYGCINVHASLLPRYRGASPISSAIVDGDSITGVTTMIMDTGMDTGDILLQSAVDISERETSGSLSQKLMELGAQLIIQTIFRIGDKSISRVAQDHSTATITRLLTKNDGHIDWNKSSAEIDRMVRGMNPWPIAFFDFKGESIKVWEAEPTSGAAKSGQVVEITRNGLAVGAGQGLIVLKQLQAPGKKRVAAFEWASSRGIRPGDVLSSQNS